MAASPPQVVEHLIDVNLLVLAIAELEVRISNAVGLEVDLAARADMNEYATKVIHQLSSVVPQLVHPDLLLLIP